jgi:hypothetical protein
MEDKGYFSKTYLQTLIPLSTMSAVIRVALLFLVQGRKQFSWEIYVLLLDREGGQRMLPELAVFPLLLAQNNQYAKVHIFRVACSRPLQRQVSRSVPRGRGYKPTTFLLSVYTSQSL